MPNQWETIEVPFATGVDTKSDDKLVTKLAVAENVEFSGIMSLSKRKGYDRIPSRILTDTSAAVGISPRAAEQLVTRGSELLAVESNALWSSDDHGVAYKGIIHNPYFEAGPKVGTGDAQSNPGVARVGHFALYTWHKAAVVYAALENTDTGALVLPIMTLDAASAAIPMPKPVVCGGHLMACWLNAGLELVTQVFAPASVGYGYGLAAVTQTGLGALNCYDIAPYNGTTVVAYSPTATDDLRLARIDEDGSVTDTATAHSGPGGGNAIDDVAVTPRPFGGVVAGWCSDAGATQRYFSRFSAGFTQTGTAVTSSSPGTAMAVACFSRGYGTDDVMCAFFSAPVGGVPTLVSYQESGSNTRYGVSLVSRAWTHGAAAYAHVRHEGTLTDTLGIIGIGRKANGSASIDLCGRIFSGRAADITRLTGVSEYSPGKFSWAGLARNRAETASRSVGEFTEPSIQRVDYDNNRRAQAVDVGGVTLFSGPVLLEYDGLQLVENNFFYFPEGGTAVAGAAGALTGTYSYILLFGRRLANGDEEWSAGIALTSAAVVASRMTLTVPYLQATKDADAFVSVWRTQVNPSAGFPYYRVSDSDPTNLSTTNGYIANDTTVATLTYTDNLTDAQIAVKELLYLNGGALDNVPAFSGSLLAAGKERIWLASGEVPSGHVLCSKVKAQGKAWAFNDALLIGVDPLTGPVTGIAVLDDALIIFKKNAVYLLEGDGPDNLAQGGFNYPRLLANSAGCIDYRSVCVGPGAVYFQDRKGIFRIGRGGQLDFVGAYVDRYKDLEIVSANILETKGQIRFLTATGPCLVYDYLRGEWTTFTDHAGYSACMLDGEYVWSQRGYLRSWPEGPDNIGVAAPAEVMSILQQSEQYTDAGQAYSSRVRTGFIAYGGKQGWQRVRRMALLGRYGSGHTLRIKVRHDYETAISQEIVFQPKSDSASSPLESTYWGDGTWGSGYWGSDGAIPKGETYQFIHRLSRQKCQAVSFEFNDEVPERVAGESELDTFNEGFEITMLSLEVAKKAGLARLYSGRKVGGE